ncbi:class D sortase [Halobacillus sp. A1]|uniref:class D sortase n=1 Tax=Halobacillus sp. A1 TaxID=2880262 RepID=UPI0020A6A265|nr:class D sortase [Halobacillus sp. A1]MCP3032869.1 class D sortase [Halobacillus sp. A1]
MIRKLGLLLFIIGIVTLGYSGWQYYQSTQSVQEIPKPSQAKASPAAAADDREEENHSTLERELETGEEIASLDIPQLDKRFDTFWGTDEDTLGSGVGMYVSEWTTVPNREEGHTVLSGHRDTVFTGLKELGEGDTLSIQYEGETYEYEITKTWITDADDRSVIVEKEEPTLTLTTCYPFDFIGNAPDRYIIEAELVT